MKIRVTKLINIRQGAPRLTALVKGVFNPGAEIEVAGTVVGDALGGNAIWYQGLDNTFYWSGGVTPTGPPVPPVPPPRPGPAFAEALRDERFGWGFEKINIAKVWQTTGSRGKGVRIAILDTGIDLNHPDLPDYVRLNHPGFIRRNFLNETTNVQDTDGHGTHCAGIIAGQGKRVWGVAPESTIMVGKVMEYRHGTGVDFGLLARAVQWAAQNGADIISMSITSFLDDEPLHRMIKSVHGERNVNVVCAIGNQGKLKNEIFPACYKECVAVGSVNRSNRKDAFSNASKELDLLAPGSEIFSTGLNGGYATDEGTSMATAFVSGVFALLRSFARMQNLEVSNFNELVAKAADDYGAIVGVDQESGYGVINPLNVLSKLMPV